MLSASIRSALFVLGGSLLIWPLVASKATSVTDVGGALTAAHPFPSPAEPSLAPNERAPLALGAANEQIERLERQWSVWVHASGVPWLPPFVLGTLGKRAPEPSRQAALDLLAQPAPAWDAPQPFTSNTQLALQHALSLSGVSPPKDDLERLLQQPAAADALSLAFQLELLCLLPRNVALAADRRAAVAKQRQRLLGHALGRLHREASANTALGVRESFALLSLASSTFRATGLESDTTTRTLARRNHALVQAWAQRRLSAAGQHADEFSWERLLLNASLVEALTSYSAAGLAPARRTRAALLPHLEALVELVSRAPLPSDPQPLSAWASGAALRALRLVVNVHAEQ